MYCCDDPYCSDDGCHSRNEGKCCYDLCIDPRTKDVYYIKDGNRCKINLFKTINVPGIPGKDGAPGKDAVAIFAHFKGPKRNAMNLGADLQISTNKNDPTKLEMDDLVEQDCVGEWVKPDPTLIEVPVPRTGKYRIDYRLTVKGGTKKVIGDVTDPNDLSTVESMLLINDIPQESTHLMGKYIDGQVGEIYCTTILPLIRFDEVRVGVVADKDGAPAYLIGRESFVFEGDVSPWALTFELLEEC